MTQEDIVGHIVEILQRLDVLYMIAGSFASNLHGVPRMTQDADLVVDLDEATVSRLVDLQPKVPGTSSAGRVPAKECAMRRVIYGGAMSLDGFIAGPNGEYDWIVVDPDIDFAEMMAQFDTFLIGRKTFEAMLRMGSDAKAMPGTRNIVFSRTLKPSDYPDLTISDDAEGVVADLRTKPGRDIALFGGGELFRSLLAAGLVDRVSVSVIPVLLGGGVPLLPSPATRATLKLRQHRLYEKTGTIRLDYDIERS